MTFAYQKKGEEGEGVGGFSPAFYELILLVKEKP